MKSLIAGALERSDLTVPSQRSQPPPLGVGVSNQKSGRSVGGKLGGCEGAGKYAMRMGVEMWNV